MRKTKADENSSSLSLHYVEEYQNNTVMRNSYAEEYQNNTVSQISRKILCMRKRLKQGVLSSARERRVWGYALCS